MVYNGKTTSLSHAVVLISNQEFSSASTREVKGGQNVSSTAAQTGAQTAGGDGVEAAAGEQPQDGYGWDMVQDPNDIKGIGAQFEGSP
jgi:hypothetical protein